MGMIEWVSFAALALVAGAIASIIWTTVFYKSRRNGWILLAVLVFLGGNQIVSALHFSTAAGLMLLTIYSVYVLLSVRRIKTLQIKETSGNPF